MRFPSTLLLAACALAPLAAGAQNFKAPIRVIVPYAPGGGADALARMVAPGLSRELGQTVLIDNKPGAGGQIGTQLLLNAPADGSVLLLTPDAPLTNLPLTVPGIRYNPLADFVPLGQTARTPWTLNIPANTPYRDFKGYAEALKREPLLRAYGVPLTGSAMEMIGEAIGKHIGAAMTVVPYSGSAPVIQNVMGGQVPAGVTGMPEAMSVSRSGKARVIAVTGLERTPLLPDTPTFKELGVGGLEFYTFVGFFGPRGLPAPLAKEFNAALRKALADPAVLEKIATLGLTPAPTTLDEASTEVHTLVKFWRDALAPKR